MSPSTTTAAGEVDKEVELVLLVNDDSKPPQLVNTDSTLPTHVLPPPAHTPPPAFNPHLPNETIPSSTNNIATVPYGKKTWLNHVKEYAPVVGVIVAIIGVIVAIVAIITFVVK